VFIGVGERQSGPATVVYVLSLFASVLLHELGHALMARRYGIRTLEMVMYPIGGISKLERQPPATQELWIAVAGPAVNLAIGLGLLGIRALQQGRLVFDPLRDPTDANLLERIALGNLVLCLFNLLPAYPMDGGRILRSFLARWRSPDEATRIAASTGEILAVLLGLAGLLGANYLLVFVAMFVYLGAMQEGAAASSRLLASGFPVRAAMITDFRTLQHGQTIRDAGELLLATSQHDFPVMQGQTPAGVLTRSALMRAMLTEGPDSYVAGAMDRDFKKVNPDMPLTEALSQLSGGGGSALVVDSEERLTGMLTPENLSEFVLLRQASLAQARAHSH
jgi:Zn-dependent protease/CBS domain-containing protein